MLSVVESGSQDASLSAVDSSKRFGRCRILDDLEAELGSACGFSRRCTCWCQLMRLIDAVIEVKWISRMRKQEAYGVRVLICSTAQRNLHLIRLQRSGRKAPT